MTITTTSSTNTPKVRVPFIPSYSLTREFLRLIDGKSHRVLASMGDVVKQNIGTPQANQDWTNPDEWIPGILSGEERQLAEYLWRSSNGLINPRYLFEARFLITFYGLVDTDAQDTLYVTDRGHGFIEDEFGEIEKELDYSEGLLNLLAIVAEHGPGKRGDFIPHYSEFLQQYTNLRSRTVIESRWYYSMRNLLDRELVQRSGISYQITDTGLAYLENASELIANTQSTVAPSQPLSDIRRLLSSQGKTVRQRLKETLSVIDPYDFEFLIKRLLEAMGYNNVEVTKRSNDGGVDVVADIEVGITNVREVVQVKRHQGNIRRPVLDQLRGTLHRFDAMRGTIITSGGFARGMQETAFERGAAPITLIDGEKLIDLLIEHDIGVRKDQIRLLKFEAADFVIDPEQTELE
jgi:restriction system protein